MKADLIAVVTKEQALSALNSMDDYARMTCGVDAHGPRETLRRFIEQSAVDAGPQDEREAFEAYVWGEYRTAELLNRRDFPSSLRAGEYCDAAIQKMWDAWQARAILSQQGGGAARRPAVEAQLHDLAAVCFAAGIERGKGAKNFWGTNGKAFEIIDAIISGLSAAPAAQPCPEGWAIEEMERLFNKVDAAGPVTLDLKRAAGIALTVMRGGRWDDSSQEWTAAPAAGVPVDMVLHCPACGHHHIDSPEPGRLISSGPSAGRAIAGWMNPPHRSHLCHGCGHVWRPADVPTNGVATVKTKGSNDSPLAAPSRIDADKLQREALEEAERALWVMAEHGTLHFGDKHSCVDTAIKARNKVRSALALHAAAEVVSATPPAQEAAPSTGLSKFVHADDATRERIGEVVGKRAFAAQEAAQPSVSGVDAQWVERAMELAEAHAHESWRRGYAGDANVDTVSREALRLHLSTALTGAEKEVK